MDRMVTGGAVPVAVREYGGDGPPVLLLHGAGGNLAHWATLAPTLADRHRVVAVDLRGHGRSGDAGWDWDAACADLDAVVAELDLPAPAVVGHSLGGLLAVEWARRHPVGERADNDGGGGGGGSGPAAQAGAGGRRERCRAVVNLDGHPTLSRGEQCPGVPAARAGELLGRLSAAFDAMEAAMGAPMSGAAVEALVAAQVGMAERYGVAPGPLAEAARRNLVERDGGWWPRPDAKLTAELRVAMAEVDPYPAYRELGCPALVVLAGRDLPEQRPFGELTEAYRGLLRARYAELAAAVPTLSVVELPASHALLLEAPDRVAELVAAAVA